VSGLLTGAAVLFNGIRVGEVTALDLDAKNSNQVFATIAVATSTPISADTKAGLEFQGLTGVPVVTLQGGSLPLDRSHPNGPVLLIADPLAGQSMTTAARDALRRLDSILSDNAEPLRSTIANLNIFSAALARNSDRLDGIVKGIERLTGATATGPRILYDLTAPTNFAGLDNIQKSELTIAEPTSLIMFESRKIVVLPSDEEEPSFANAEWSDSTPKLIYAKILQAFENAGLARAVFRPSDNVTSENQLVFDIRKFQVSKSPTLNAEVELSVKLISSGKIVDARVFAAKISVHALNASAAAAALDLAFGKCVTELVPWAVQSR
jgi:phospholipid/cholesterol/gamma-HCH transport system substrate-binding protein